MCGTFHGSKFILLTNALWGCLLKTLIGCSLFGVSMLMEIKRDTLVATITKHENSGLNGVLTRDICAADRPGPLPVAVITGDPAEKASFVYSCRGG